MSRKVLWTLAGAVVALSVAGGVVAIKLSQFQSMGEAASQMVIPPEVVNVIDVHEATLQRSFTAVGSMMAVNGTEVSTEAEGVVRTIYFSPGATVKQGDALLQLDIDVEETQLRAAEAAARSSQLALTRVQELRKSNSVSQADIDIADSNATQAEAQVDYIRALITKKTVRAPFSGRLGLRRISEGQFLAKGSAVVSLQALDPLYVEFSVPQQKLAQLAPKQPVMASVDALPSKAFEGKVVAIHPQIDIATRNVRVQALVPNRQGELLPGMYVSVEVMVGKPEKALLIPETAVLHGATTETVFVIGEGAPSTAGETFSLTQRNVQLGARQGDFIEVISGLKLGEKVVSTGVFKLRSGATVVIDQRLSPTFTLHPTPDNT